MNRRIILHISGKMLMLEALLLMLPVFVSACYKEWKVLTIYLAVASASLAVGAILNFVGKTKNRTIFAKEGFAIVTVVWILMSMVGAVPFVITGEIPNYIDAVFETVSGFTTTGASIMRDVTVLSHGSAMWRSFTHWIGGMGVLVFVMALSPNISDRSIHIMRAEMPGPIIGKLLPRIKDTAKILYIIYVCMTLLEVILLKLGGITLFESFIYSFGTAGTGGFGIKPDSLGSYSPYIQWVITAFMFLFSINLNLYYLILIKKFSSAVKSRELWFFFSVVAVALTIVTINIYHLYSGFSEAIRQSAFQIGTIVSTTGYSSADFNQWPTLSKSVMFLLMFMGGCAGSTAGGLKVSRIQLVLKVIKRELAKLIHPNSVNAVKLEGKTVDDETLHNVATYVSLYFVLFAIMFFVLAFEPFSLETNITAVTACFNNIGPGLGGVGPASCYADYSILSKIVLTFGMLAGRLEIFPLLIAFTPSVWIKK